MTAKAMRRGAQEANEESDRRAVARDIGTALGVLGIALLQVEKLMDRVDKLERQVAELKDKQP